MCAKIFILSLDLSVKFVCFVFRFVLLLLFFVVTVVTILKFSEYILFILILDKTLCIIITSKKCKPARGKYINLNVIEYYIKLVRLVGWLVGFYGISNFVGYLMPNLFFTNLFLYK